jgi:hypothetical protein
MTDDERIERVQKLQKEGFKVNKSPTLVLGNIYSLITIVTVSLAILIYVNYVQPSFEKQKQQEQLAKEKKEYFEQRAKQIELSRKLNAPQENDDDTNTK